MQPSGVSNDEAEKWVKRPFFSLNTYPYFFELCEHEDNFYPIIIILLLTCNNLVRISMIAVQDDIMYIYPLFVAQMVPRSTLSKCYFMCMLCFNCFLSTFSRHSYQPVQAIWKVIIFKVR